MTLSDFSCVKNQVLKHIDFLFVCFLLQLSLKSTVPLKSLSFVFHVSSSKIKEKHQNLMILHFLYRIKSLPLSSITRKQNQDKEVNATQMKEDKILRQTINRWHCARFTSCVLWACVWVVRRRSCGRDLLQVSAAQSSSRQRWLWREFTQRRGSTCRATSNSLVGQHPLHRSSTPPST